MSDLRRYDDWLTWLRERGESDPDIQVVFVGGSAVTGGYDDHSDLDVDVLATPGESTAAYLDTDLPEGYAARIEALLPGPGLAERAAAAFAWQDELLAGLASA